MALLTNFSVSRVTSLPGFTILAWEWAMASFATQIGLKTVLGLETTLLDRTNCTVDVSSLMKLLQLCSFGSRRPDQWGQLTKYFGALYSELIMNPTPGNVM